MRVTRILRAAAFALVLVPSVALGQQAPPSKTKSEAIYKEAVELAKANKLEAALAKFDEARAAAPNARATYQMARMEQALNRPDVALFHYRQALTEEGLPTGERNEAVKAIEDLKTKIGVITIDSPPGVTVTVDGNAVPDPRQPVEVAPGPHIIKGSLGGESRIVETSLDAGKVAAVKISFDKPSANVPPGPGTGTSTGTGVTPPAEPPTSFWTTPHIAGVGLLGLGAVGLGLSAVFFISREGNISDQETLAPRCIQPGSPDCRAFDDAGDSASSAKTIGIVSGVVGLAAAGAGAALLLWPTSPSKTGSARDGRDGIRIAPTGNGAVVFGSF